MATATLGKLESILEFDTKVKLAGLDVDGQLRGKIMSKSKFLDIASTGFGYCSVVFCFDMHDTFYFRELRISNKENGYKDLLAKVDLGSFRRIPWEDNIPFFLCEFWDAESGKRVCACPKGLLRTQVEKLDGRGWNAMAGAEYEFYQFQTPLDSDGNRSMARYLQNNPPSEVLSVTAGSSAYSLTRPLHNKDYFYGIFDACEKFDCGIESWHTEVGPGVYEAALSFQEVANMADRAALFKYTAKCIAAKHGVTPCFMAKPRQGLSGNSGHMHISLVDKSGKNLFARSEPDQNPLYPDLTHFSELARHFLAGILNGLPDVMPIFAPTINSYKRLVENAWAPVTVSWGLEHRAASIRLIAPPTCSASATRFEVRVPGADSNPHYVLAAILALGYRGIEQKMEIDVEPLTKGEDMGGEGDKGARLAKSLKEATDKMMEKGSGAREVFGDEFVDFFGGTREHECRLWDEAVTDWEFQRYVENV